MKRHGHKKRMRKWVLLLSALIIILYVLAVKGIGITHHAANNDYGWNLMLVNHENYIPHNYKVELTELSNGEKVDSRIYPDLQDMFDDARAQGYGLFVAAGYRTTEKQQQLMDEKIDAIKMRVIAVQSKTELAEQWVQYQGNKQTSDGHCC